MTRLPPSSTLFPYTTLFRSALRRGPRREGGRLVARGRSGGQRRGRRRFGAAGPWGVSGALGPAAPKRRRDRKSTRLNSSHTVISYAVFCLKKKKKKKIQ